MEGEEEKKEISQFPIRPVKVERIEGRKLFSFEETHPVLIPRLQAEALTEMLSEGDVWHVTPWPKDFRKETSLTLTAFDHQPTPEELTLENVEEFLKKSLPKISVEVRGSLEDYKNLRFVIEDMHGKNTLDTVTLVEYMAARWFPLRKKEPLPQFRKKTPKYENWMTVPEGTPIRTAPLTGETHAEIVQRTQKSTPLPFVRKIEEGDGRVHYDIPGRGWITVRYRGEKREIL
jgi:hypothetical protein